MSVELSIVIPAYNEQERIRPTLEEYIAHFRTSHAGSFEVIVVLNGCRDDTRSVVEAVAANAAEIRLVEFQKPLGKGGALYEGLGLAEGQLLAFVDADNMVRASEAAKLIYALKAHDIAIGDRFHGETNDSQSILRGLISKGSRLWVRRFLGLPYSDTQCGAKALRSVAWKAIAPSIAEHGWAFDLELLAHTRRLGFSVAEIPVRWQHIAQGSKVRPWRDVPTTLLATFRIRRHTRLRS